MDCQSQTQVSDQVLARDTLGKIQNDPQLQETLICVLKKLNFMNKDGKLDIDVIEQAIGDYFGKYTEEFRRNCLVDKNTPSETAEYYAYCYRQLENKKSQKNPDYTQIIYNFVSLPFRVKKVLTCLFIE